MALCAPTILVLIFSVAAFVYCATAFRSVLAWNGAHGELTAFRAYAKSSLSPDLLALTRAGVEATGLFTDKRGLMVPGPGGSTVDIPKLDASYLEHELGLQSWVLPDAPLNRAWQEWEIPRRRQVRLPKKEVLTASLSDLFSKLPQLWQARLTDVAQVKLVSSSTDDRVQALVEFVDSNSGVQTIGPIDVISSADDAVPFDLDTARLTLIRRFLVRGFVDRGDAAASVLPRARELASEIGALPPRVAMDVLEHRAARAASWSWAAAFAFLILLLQSVSLNSKRVFRSLPHGRLVGRESVRTGRATFALIIAPVLAGAAFIFLSVVAGSPTSKLLFLTAVVAAIGVSGRLRVGWFLETALSPTTRFFNRNECDLRRVYLRPWRQLEPRSDSSLVRGRCLAFDVAHGRVPSARRMRAFCRAAISLTRRHGSTPTTYTFFVGPTPGSDLLGEVAKLDDASLLLVLLTGSAVEDSLRRGDELETLRKCLESHVGRADPFKFLREIIAPAEFFGRQAERRRLLDQLARGQSVGIFGMRKVGKSSLLHDAMRGRPGPVVWVDCQSRNPLQVLMDLPGDALSAMQSMAPGDAWAPFSAKGRQGRQLAGKVEECLRANFALYRERVTEPVGVLTFVLDEIDRLVADALRSTEQRRDFEALMGLLRSLSVGTNPIGVAVVAGFSSEITRYDQELSTTEAGSPSFLFFDSWRLRPMVEEDLQEMMATLGASARLAFRADAMKEIFTLSGGHPLCARLIGSAILAQRDLLPINPRSGFGDVRVEDVERALDLMRRDIDRREGLERIVRSEGHELARRMVLLLSIAGTEGMEAESLKGLTGDKDDSRAVDVLDELRASGVVVDRDGRCLLAIRMMMEKHGLVRAGEILREMKP